MNSSCSRRRWLGWLGSGLGWLAALPAAKAAKSTVKNLLTSSGAPKGYDPTKHQWLMCIDVDRCIGCGLCVDACKIENKVSASPHYFRTWIERYLIRKPKPGQLALRGEVTVDSPNGGRDGFPPTLVPKSEILKAFYVPKLCNLCEHSPCSQACPVGATFDTPDGAVLVDPEYCIGCGFCIQACPYGCRFMNPDTHTAEKCTLCYHRITRGLKPACVEVCPTQTRIFGDLKNMTEKDPVQEFIRNNKVFTLKPNLGTEPRVLYANIDKEVR
ncbi:MAG: 4Fe-4S dicluster domain-containing protein [Verrucomicrobia bacterium]|nr:4Fe-4S dicluster domain-containing protein [Verrucomicrobiota bacterium]